MFSYFVLKRKLTQTGNMAASFTHLFAHEAEKIIYCKARIIGIVAHLNLKLNMGLIFVM